MYFCDGITAVPKSINFIYLPAQKQEITVSGKKSTRSIAKCFKCQKETSSAHFRRNLKAHKIPPDEIEAEVAKWYTAKTERCLKQCPLCEKLVRTAYVHFLTYMYKLL